MRLQKALRVLRGNVADKKIIWSVESGQVTSFSPLYKVLLSVFEIIFLYQQLLFSPLTLAPLAARASI